MKRFLIIAGLVLMLAALLGTEVFANTAMAYMRIGRLWMICEYDGAEGWSGQASWPGGYPIAAFSGVRELWDANMRKTGTVAGCTDWTGPNGILYPYWTSGMYRSYHYEYLPYWTAWEDMTQLFPVDQKEYLRWPPPRVIVNGSDIVPDAGANYTLVHDNAEIKPDLIAPRAVMSEWDYSMGVTYTRWAYAYGTPKHQDYVLWDLTFTNSGRMNQTETVLSGQTVNNFWWAQTGNPWNSRAGRTFSYGNGSDDEVGEFIQPYINQGDERRFYLFYDGDKPSTPEVDWADPSVDSRYVRLLSPAWIAYGALHCDTSPTNIADDPSQPKATKIAQERDLDLSRIPKTMQEQYETLFTEGDHWQLNTPHTEIEPRITRPSGYPCYGPFTMGPGEDIHISFVWAAGGLGMEECRRLGSAAVRANFSGPIMDEIKTLFFTGRDSVQKTLEQAWWNVKGDKGGHPPYDVPDAPRPPATFSVKSAGPKILLEWTDESRNDPDFDTGVNDFAGYRIYRAVGRRDSTYYRVWEGTANKWEDTNVSEGIQYFYYLVAYDNGSQNWQDPGVSLECSRFWCWTGWAPEGVTPTSAPITAESEFEKIRVVPNPYSAAGKNFGGEFDRIRFVGLPGTCTIRIYTCAGDFVHKIEHTDGSGAEDWDLRTEFNQYLASDLYIFTVDSDIGTHAGKFVVIR